MRTIAEILAYNREYSPELNPNLFDEDGVMHIEVHDKILEIVDTFMEYAQVEDVKISDVRVVGSNASYNYNENSDLDVHIVTDLSKISKPETIASLYFGEVKHAFKEAYDITIKGIEVELYVEDVNATAVTNGIYSVTQDKWIKEPEKMKDPTESELSQAEAIEDEIVSALEKAETEDEMEDIIDKLYVMRKDALASKGETAPANLAFKSLRNKGILTRAKDEIKKKVSKRLSLENRKVRESFKVVTYDARGNMQSNSVEFKGLSGAKKYVLDAIRGEDLPSYVTGIEIYDNSRNISVDYRYKENGRWVKDRSFNESKRVREMSRTPNKYWIYTEDYSFMKKDERERADYLTDSDNTTAYGPADLVYKLKSLKDMNIKVKKVYQTYKDETTNDVTDKYKEYLL